MVILKRVASVESSHEVTDHCTTYLSMTWLKCSFTEVPVYQTKNATRPAIIYML